MSGNGSEMALNVGQVYRTFNLRHGQRFLYSVYGQGGGERHRDDPAIAAYRNAWLDALLVDRDVEAVVTLGRLAAQAFEQWRATPAGRRVEVPTRP